MTYPLTFANYCFSPWRPFRFEIDTPLLPEHGANLSNTKLEGFAFFENVFIAELRK